MESSVVEAEISYRAAKVEFSDDDADEQLRIEEDNGRDNSDDEAGQRRSFKADPIFRGSLTGNDAVFLGLENKLNFSFSASKVSDTPISVSSRRRQSMTGSSHDAKSDKQQACDNQVVPTTSADNLL